MPTKISEETAARVAIAWDDILSRVAAGERFLPILATHSLTYEQVRGYWNRSPELRAQWDGARRDSADAFVNAIHDIAYNTDANPTSATASMLRVQLEALTRLVEKLNPERYAPRTRADINVRHVDLTAIIAAAQRRVAARDARLIGGSSTIDSERLHTSHVLDSMVLADLV